MFAGRISGVETLEEFDELPAAVAVSDERMDLAGKQVDSGQQAQRAMTFVLVIPREGRVDAGLGQGAYFGLAGLLVRFSAASPGRESRAASRTPTASLRQINS